MPWLDSAQRCRYYRSIPIVAMITTIMVAHVAGCAVRRSAIADPAADRVEKRVVQATAPARPVRIEFTWHLQERAASFSGRGIARVAPPYRLRLDLFGPRGATILSAAIIDGELRLSPTAQGASVAIPPAALLWSAVGVFRPPTGAERTEASGDGGTVRLGYTGPRGRWTFTLVDGRVREAAFWPEADGRHTVQMNGTGPNGVPTAVRYRDYAAFRELELDIEHVNESEPFPTEIWTLTP